MNGIDPTGKAAILEAMRAALSDGGPSRRARRSEAHESAEGQKGLKQAAEDFEALFINQMLKAMRETVAKTDLFHGGPGEDIYTSLMDMELSKDMARGGGIGLSEVLLRQFSGPSVVIDATPGAWNRTGASSAPAGTGTEAGVVNETEDGTK